MRTICVMGVYAEGCVRASVVQAIKQVYSVIVIVIAHAVTSNAKWKKAFALRAMARAWGNHPVECRSAWWSDGPHRGGRPLKFSPGALLPNA